MLILVQLSSRVQMKKWKSWNLKPHKSISQCQSPHLLFAPKWLWNMRELETYWGASLSPGFSTISSYFSFFRMKTIFTSIWHPNGAHFDGELPSKWRPFLRPFGTQTKAISMTNFHLKKTIFTKSIWHPNEGHFGSELAPKRRLSRRRLCPRRLKPICDELHIHFGYI